MEQAPENVTFAGFVDRETLREAYCGADVFAFMSHEETEGIVVLEALACGIPTVVRDIPVYNGWLREGQNVYKASGTDEFQQKAEGLLTGTLPDLTAAGRRVAEERSLSVMGECLREVYRRMDIRRQRSRRQKRTSLRRRDPYSTASHLNSRYSYGIRIPWRGMVPHSARFHSGSAGRR